MKFFIKYLAIAVFVLSAVVLIHLFLVGSYRITGHKTGDTLQSGDCVLVNKLKSKDNPDRNRLVIYKSPLRRDLSKPPLFVGRCIGLPGDMIQMGVDGFRVNGRLLPNAPLMQPAFRIRKNIKEPLLKTLQTLQIPYRQMKEDSVEIILRMSLREKELLLNNLTDVIPVEMIEETGLEYEFVIPGKGKSVNINEISLMVCKEALMNELDSAAVIRDGKLFINGEETSSFTFRQDYFWILSENETDGIDSRHLGLIPKNHVSGNIWFCWYSKHPANRFKRIR